MVELVYATAVVFDLSFEDEHGRLDTAEFAGIWAAASREASR
jgi:hypothetical protein